MKKLPYFVILSRKEVWQHKDSCVDQSDSYHSSTGSSHRLEKEETHICSTSETRRPLSSTTVQNTSSKESPNLPKKIRKCPITTFRCLFLPTKGHNFEDTGVRQGHALFNMTNALLNITNALLNMTNALLNMANDLLTITNDLLIDQRSAQYVRPFI